MKAIYKPSKINFKKLKTYLKKITNGKLQTDRQDTTNRTII